jgi:integrase
MPPPGVGAVPAEPAWLLAAFPRQLAKSLGALAFSTSEPGQGRTAWRAEGVPLIGLAKDALTARMEAQEADRAKLGRAWTDTGLVFTTRTGRPIEPRNLVRSFARICEDGGIRKIRVHALRHTTAKLLKDLGVPARDTQTILGHAHVSTTQQIYTYVDEAAQRTALNRLNELLGGTK